MSSDLLDVAAISRDCIHKKSKVLVVIADASNLDVLIAACSIALKYHSNIVGVFSLIGPKYEVYKSYLSNKLKLTPRIVALHVLSSVNYLKPTLYIFSGFVSPAMLIAK